MVWRGNLVDFGPVPVAVDVYWESYPGKKAHIWKLWNRSGWIQVSRVYLDTPLRTFVDTIVSFCDEYGRKIGNWFGQRLFDMRFSFPKVLHLDPPEELEDIEDAKYWDFLGRCDQSLLNDLSSKENDTEQALLKSESSLEQGLREIDEFIAALRRERRHHDCTADRKQEIDKRIAKVNAWRPVLLATLPKEREKLRAELEIFEADIEECLTIHGRIEPLYTVYWSMVSRQMPPRINRSLWTEHRYEGNLNAGSIWREHMRAGHRVDAPLGRLDPITPKKRKKRKRQVETKNTGKRRGRPPGSKNKTVQTEPEIPPIKPITNVTAQDKSQSRKRKREIRRQIADILKLHGTLAELKTVWERLRGKTGTALKAALADLARHDYMKTDDAVYLYGIISALRPKSDDRPKQLNRNRT